MISTAISIGNVAIFAEAFFLGAGAGPALIGALLAAREEAGSGAINSLYTLDRTAPVRVHLLVCL